MTDAELHAFVESYYSGRILLHGVTPAGVDWKDDAAQELRFAQFNHLWRDEQAFSLNDLGCGYGALLEYLRRQRLDIDYRGIDLSPPMVEAAAELHGHLPHVSFSVGAEPASRARFTVASGIFNVKGGATAEDWRLMVFNTIKSMASFSEAGFAFNVLTDHSDRHLQRPDLFYADPAEIVDFCGRNISRHIRLIQDYGLYDFTMIVRL